MIQRFLSLKEWTLAIVVVLLLCGGMGVGLSDPAAGDNARVAAAQGVLAPQEMLTITASVDTYVSQGSPTTSHGSQPFMWAARDEFLQEQLALVQFDLSAIPSGSTINSATLQAYLFDGGSSTQTISVCRVTSSWSSSVTWNTQPGLSSCGGWGSASIPTGPTNVYYAWNVTALVTNWWNGTYSNYGLALRGPNTVNWAKGFRTNEEGHAARLVIDYTPPMPTVSPTATTSPGSIGDRVWHDANHNGVQDAGEPGLSDVGLSLVQGDVVLATTTTSGSGAYLFSGLSAGTYTVNVDDWTLPAGYVLVSGEEPWTVTLGAGDNRLDIDLGYALPPTPTPSPTPVQDLAAYSLEVTQAIQNLPHQVRLVAGKRTFVRFYARTAGPDACCAVPSTAVLRVQRGAEERWLLPLNPGGRYNVFRYMPRFMENGAFLFELPSGFREGTVTLTAHVNPGPPLVPWARLPESSYGNNSTTRTVTFEPVPTLNVHVYRVGYQVSGSSYLADTSHADALVDWLRRAYPVSDVRARYELLFYLGDADVDDRGRLTDPNCDRVNSNLSSFVSWARGMAPPNSVTRLYGMVDDGGAFMRGCSGSIPSTQASGPTGAGTWGWDTDGSYGDWYGGHEIGHSLGRLHAEFCGAEGGGYYPYSYGRISPILPLGHDPFLRLYGYDSGTGRIYPDSWRDVMTYCPLEWVSDFTYEGLMDYLQDHASAALAASPSGAVDRLLVSGSIDPFGDEVRLDPLFVLPEAEEVQPRVPGAYAIVLRDAAGQALARYPFTPVLMHSGPPPPEAAEDEAEIHVLSIFEMVPFVAGTDRVDIEGPGGALLHSVSAGGAAPQVTITAPHGGVLLGTAPATISWTASDADGDDLTFLVQYLAEGQDWKSVGLPTTQNSLEVPVENVVSSGSARFRVLASDGVHTTVAVSDPFTVPNRAPTVQIRAPQPGLTVHISQTVNLEGWAYDADSGLMSGAPLSWTSDLDGPLGDGAQVSVSGLSGGLHTLTFEADDGAGGVQTDSVQLTVVSDLEALPPAADELIGGPLLVSFAPWAGLTSETLYVDNLNGSHAVSWQASASEPWVELSATSGTTPQDFTASLGDVELPPGLHTATITLSSPDLPGEAVVIPVELLVEEAHVHLPVITKR